MNRFQFDNKLFILIKLYDFNAIIVKLVPTFHATFVGFFGHFLPKLPSNPSQLMVSFVRPGQLGFFGLHKK